MERDIQPARRLASKDLRIERTRAALHQAFLELLAQIPFEQLTVKAVTARANTGYATFFRHYHGLDQLLADVAAKEIDQLLAQTIPVFDTVNSLRSCEALCDYVAGKHSLWRSLLTGGAWPRVREEFVAKAHDLVPATDRPPGPIPSSLAVVFATSAVLDILAWWLRDESGRPPSEIAAYINTLAVSPVV